MYVLYDSLTTTQRIMRTKTTTMRANNDYVQQRQTKVKVRHRATTKKEFVCAPDETGDNQKLRDASQNANR